MEHLSKRIERGVCQWRDDGYPCKDYPLISVILRYQLHEDDPVSPRYLRSAQFLALETYWYLRLVRNTPNILDLYKGFYEGENLLKALGVPYDRGELKWVGASEIIDKFIKGKPKGRGHDALYESLTLSYPSYIFALAMGAGKTVLIGAIIATEFAMGSAYPESSFMRNALVFAPGTTIIESLRELSRVPYHEILPTAQYKIFMANLRMCYVSEAKDIGVIQASQYNLIVTNTEKIILRKSKRKNSLLYDRKKLEENQRLQTIASLPHLGIFSDEAHHTYGNRVGDDLKRVRATINRLEGKIVCVINTTGTPYYKKKMLRDVVIWYGIAEGIRDNVLKSLHNGVMEYDFSKEAEAEVAVRIVHDFYETYGDVALPSGAKAKVAFYFNRQEDLDRAKNYIAQALAEIGASAASVLVNTQQSSKDELEEFNRLDDPSSEKRVILLVAKGREGWNCLSLFACALITQQTTASNFVLQAAARCLRQVPGNTHTAKVYLDTANKDILNKELQENFGERTSLDSLSSTEQEKKVVRVRVLKTEMPKLEVEQTVRRWRKRSGTEKPLVFTGPTEGIAGTIRRHRVQVDQPESPLVETQAEDVKSRRSNTVYTVAMQVAAVLHISPIRVLKALQQAYPEGFVPEGHTEELHKQAEACLGPYEAYEERVTRVLALIHTHNNQGDPFFEEQGGHLYHTLQFSKSNYERIKKNHLLVCKKGPDNEPDYVLYDDRRDLSFHYSPYSFDSGPERKFFRKILDRTGVGDSDIEGFFFMGGLTDPQKTDFWFEYQGTDGHYHKYFPDFVLVKKDGGCCIVEIKSERDKDAPDTKAKAKAVRQIADLNPEKVKYHVVYDSRDRGPSQGLSAVLAWINNRK